MPNSNESGALAALSLDAQSPTYRPETVGRYVLHRPIARGGMATIHLARLEGADGFSRLVAAKRLHPEFTEDKDFVEMFLDEAKIASSIQHPNVVPVLDVVRVDGEVVLVQEYVHGVPLDRLCARLRDRVLFIPQPILLGIIVGVLNGLHAAHEAKNELGAPLNIVHRDISPQNIIVGADGIPKLIDFGIAKAASSAHVTKAGLFKGKIAYMSAEQLRGEETDRRTDIYAMGMLLWEVLAGRRAFNGVPEAKIFAAVLKADVPSIESALVDREVPPSHSLLVAAFAPLLAKSIALDPNARYATAADMADAVAALGTQASPKQIGAWVREVGADFMVKRDKALAEESTAATATGRNRAIPEAAGSVRSGIEAIGTANISQVSEQGASPSQVSATGSQVSGSQVSVVEARSKVAMIAAIVVLLLVVAGLVGYVLRDNRPKGAEAVPTTDLRGQGAASAAPTLNNTAPVERLSPREDPSGAASALATATASAGHAKGKVVFVGVAPKPTAPKSSASPTVDCSTPFYFEGTRKVFKPGCL
jgi:eukaryotic-like serine/threonine-protein kinase